MLLWRGRPVEGIQLSSSMLARVSELEERLTDARLDCSEAKLRMGGRRECRASGQAVAVRRRSAARTFWGSLVVQNGGSESRRKLP